MGTEAMSGKAQASGEYVVHGAAGTGSTPVEATLTLVGQPYRVIEKGSWQETAAGEEMARVNPMRQIPALVLPTGEVMTESAAILIWLADRHPEARLAPGIDDPRRGQFLAGWRSSPARSIRCTGCATCRAGWRKARRRKR
jgi:GST-like protein